MSFIVKEAHDFRWLLVWSSLDQVIWSQYFSRPTPKEGVCGRTVSGPVHGRSNKQLGGQEVDPKFPKSSKQMKGKDRALHI